MEDVACQSPLRFGSLPFVHLSLLGRFELHFQLISKSVKSTFRNLFHVVHVEKEGLKDDEIEVVANPAYAGGNDHSGGHNKENTCADHGGEAIYLETKEAYGLQSRCVVKET